jgi:ferredoxin
MVLAFKGTHRRMGVDMRIVVDLNRCLGYAQCVPLAPDVLQLNGEEALMYDPNPDDAQRLRILRAAASCPVQAILVDQVDESESTTKP